jgi:hypothetical protein
LTAAYDTELTTRFAEHEWEFAAVASLLVLPWIACIVGLLVFKRWARTLALYVTVITQLAYLVFGPMLLSGFEMMLFESAALCWGATLALAYYSSVSKNFEAR